ncbi:MULTISPECIES: 30S ribosomal protein S20 [unclassified Oceanobacter]|uniref:30S ribosomal protein S20 n=1 Tax=unclassified Oceanobacter TaxID=2620260 RepID=UPI0026E2ABF6|nr:MULTISPECIES: 30S ribosomal protein S20 [unclassified Oceanobacter]MDO6681247.1 30S ribosomal protein S20 [Oceanobacter sp. 5_MG-2023]MDP2505234.1 30S ribosomal protein S20 [Oceanobacter sp. 3_MG-2023]MDP2549219.1 30S ribosomal protein S20 [Oceanobacter sp. 4_MG-2023]MDP2607992.1 30S ribosomal protein S20 [Oceanobacter sp. 1_MG-2023]MDP2611346.1 30S ribosomal protein S20 [Oceanobacter sp. 2_MG-2023]
MANSAGSRKRARQAIKRRARTIALRSMVRTYIKKVHAAVASDNYEQAQAAFVKAQPYIDKMVNKGILHKNTAARTKSRLNSQVVALKG